MSCSKNNTEIIQLDFQNDLIPEGIAIEPNSKTLFLNSLKHNKIVSSKLNGEGPGNFIESNQYGYLSGFGMTIKGDTLFALGNSLPKHNNRSILLMLNTNTGDLIDVYKINDSSFIYLNDIAVSSKHEIYITDSESNTIYTISNSKRVLEVFLKSDAVAHSNGISISDDGKYLYLASFRNGIRVVDITSKAILNQPSKGSRGIDGLKFYNNSLIGIINTRRENKENGVYRFFLNKEGTSIVRKEKLISFDERFKIPTTFEILENHIYFVMNSQLNNFNPDTNEIIDTGKLESYFLMKKKID